MYSVTIFLLLGSLLVQSLAAVVAVLQMRRARGYRVAWGAVALAVALSVLLRFGPLELALTTGIYDFFQALVSTLISLAMLLGLLGLRRVFADLERQQRRLETLAVTDALTGLCNRRYALERGAQELVRSARSGDPLALLMVDIDHFRLINERHGQAAGDALLVAVADVLRAGLRQIDVLGRMGGEEFLLILPSTDQAAALAIAERLRSRIAQLGVVLQGGERVGVTASFGVVSGRVAGEVNSQLKELLMQADTALYVAKERGRNRVEAWSAEMVIQAS